MQYIQHPLADSKIDIDDVIFITTHAMSTGVGDLAEIIPTRKVSSQAIPPHSSTKSLSGHTMGTAGANALIFCMARLQYQFIVPSTNIKELDPHVTNIPIVPDPQDAEIDVVVSTASGVEGTNSSLVFRKCYA